jgi:hypothetical protein
VPVLQDDDREDHQQRSRNLYRHKDFLKEEYAEKMAITGSMAAVMIAVEAAGYLIHEKKISGMSIDTTEDEKCKPSEPE